MPTTCRRVFVIGLDGAVGRCVREADTPHLDRLAAKGVVTYAARTVVPSASYEAWGAMFHGVGPRKHRISGERPCPDEGPFPSFMKVLKEHAPGRACAAFSCWNPINTTIIEPGLPCDRVSMPDEELTAAASEYIRSKPPHVFFMQLDHIDGAGHSHGYGSDAYLAQIAETDRHVGRVVEAIEAAGVMSESLIVFLSDHGGLDRGHGGDAPECLEILWGCCGPGIRHGVELDGHVDIMDTGPVVLRAFGLPLPEGWDGKVPAGVFASGP